VAELSPFYPSMSSHPIDLPPRLTIDTAAISRPLGPPTVRACTLSFAENFLVARPCFVLQPVVERPVSVSSACPSPDIKERGSPCLLRHCRDSSLIHGLSRFYAVNRLMGNHIAGTLSLLDPVRSPFGCRCQLVVILFVFVNPHRYTHTAVL